MAQFKSKDLRESQGQRPVDPRGPLMQAPESKGQRTWNNDIQGGARVEGCPRDIYIYIYIYIEREREREREREWRENGRERFCSGWTLS
jgi:hypothetical protein